MLHVEKMDVTTSLWDLGLNAITANELIQNLEKRLELTLESTLLLEYPTIDALTCYLSSVKNDSNSIEKNKNLVTVRSRVVSALHRLLQIEPNIEIDQQAPIWDLGLDSFGSIELVQRLGKELNLPLNYALLFSYPTISALSDHIVDLLSGIDSNDGGSQFMTEPLL